jgi:hypothetical protein
MVAFEQCFSAVGQPITDDSKAHQPGLDMRKGWATPLLSAGNQRVASERLYHHLRERCRTGFRHLHDLERLIVFDRQRSALEQLAVGSIWSWAASQVSTTRLT